MKSWLLCLFVTIVWCRDGSEWRSRSIYQLLTDRFSPSNFTYTRCIEEEMSESALRHYCGGTYRGMIDQLDYIIQMGFNAIWISPIPLNVDEETAYGVGWHGYWQTNLFRLNDKFGSEKDLMDLVDEAHRRDVWVMLDVVANHLGPNLTTDYYPFDQAEHFHRPPCLIKDYQNQTEVEFCSVGDERTPLPDLNTENAFVVSTLNSWIKETVVKYRIDGIRIDTFRHIRQPFWRDYIRSSNVYSLGEVASPNTSYVGSYQNVAQGVLHYPLYFQLKSIFEDDDQKRKSIINLEKQVRENEEHFRDSTLCGVFLDNHDQDRFLNHTQNPIRIANALVYLMLSDGIPIVYMGTEQNFRGNPREIYGATDPWNREPLWRSNYNRSTWIYQYLTKLNQIRALLKRDYHDEFFLSHQQTISIDNETYVYQKGPILVFISNQPFDRLKTFALPQHLRFQHWKDLLSNQIKSSNSSTYEIQTDGWNPLVLLPVSSSIYFDYTLYLLVCSIISHTYLQYTLGF